MSLHIYIAHSGEHLLADPVSFASYVPIKSVHRITSIPTTPLVFRFLCSSLRSAPNVDSRLT